MFSPTGSFNEYRVDVLEGSGLARQGSTVQRVIASVIAAGVKSPLPQASALYVGIWSGLSTSVPQILAPGEYPMLDWKVEQVGAPGDPIGTISSTSPLGPLADIDVEGQRVLGSGESVWVGIVPFALNQAADIGNAYRVTTRVLVMNPA